MNLCEEKHKHMLFQNSTFTPRTKRVLIPFVNTQQTHQLIFFMCDESGMRSGPIWRMISDGWRRPRMRGLLLCQLKATSLQGQFFRDHQGKKGRRLACHVGSLRVLHKLIARNLLPTLHPFALFQATNPLSSTKTSVMEKFTERNLHREVRFGN